MRHRRLHLPAWLLSAVTFAAALTAQEPAPPPPAPSPPAITSAKELGITFAQWSSKLRRAIVHTRTPYGFAIRGVADGSPAAKAGLAPGWIVLRVDGKPLRQVADLDAALRAAPPGHELVLHCARRKAKVRLLDRRPWETVDVKVVLQAAGR